MLAITTIRSSFLVSAPFVASPLPSWRGAYYSTRSHYLAGVPSSVRAEQPPKQARKNTRIADPSRDPGASGWYGPSRMGTPEHTTVDQLRPLLSPPALVGFS